MEIAKEIKDFLTTRRARITPDQVGLPAGGRRRVAGLRREEVALLAGVSAEYYVQIERGGVAGVSDEVLDAIATALRLDDEETKHLFTLARAAATKPRRRKPAKARVEMPEPVQALVDAMITAPAVVQNGLLDIVGANALGRALYADVYDRVDGAPNLARFIFLDRRADETFPDWTNAADDAVAMLRVEAARSPYSAAVTGLVGELATRSDEFRTRWAAHDIKAHRRGTKRFHHPVVGDLTLRFEALEVASAAGLTLYGFTASPGSSSEEALRLLSSWIATDSSAHQPSWNS
ncbi:MULTISPECIES: helix-turn-helix domain-containing protein [Rhodococcus]|jgi:transcriptional regulator with XRE-family HTH domain|uniref:XRE family transcriptional regulator n=1 Tax=Rhodococcus opacus TaxID=37919 RepID=A0A076EQ61_RHOOP|nr:MULTISPECIES: helix-turn-helix transcriptional regulator [Rhodococcus]AII08071.1 XRE family transcriptional regulator [Rhodococcus opacus]MDH6286391.1 transcriptional regulator with XRE-family HTH domain [Rhodococcus opacus]WAM12266.1 helix-turn-helix transcriptional regulator [Rhodococcus sp. JS3073]